MWILTLTVRGLFFYSRRHPLNHREIRIAIYVANPSLSCIYDMTTLAHIVLFFMRSPSPIAYAIPAKHGCKDDCIIDRSKSSTWCQLHEVWLLYWGGGVCSGLTFWNFNWVWTLTGYAKLAKYKIIENCPCPIVCYQTSATKTWQVHYSLIPFLHPRTPHAHKH